jgi:putative methanogenesis marker protein 6
MSSDRLKIGIRDGSEYAGTVTKYVFVESNHTTPDALALQAYELAAPVMIKETCFGLQVTGDPADVGAVIARIREVDPSHIFVKDRGFPPGDARRCRANMGGARPGYFGHESEVLVLRYVSYGLQRMYHGDTLPEPALETIRSKEHIPLSDERLLEIFKHV